MHWPQIRAALIALAIAFGLINGLPLPSPKDTPAWEVGFVEPLRHVQHVLLWPVRQVGPTLRISQRWSLYQAPGKWPWRMWIEGDRDGQWTILYRAGDPDHTDDADILDCGRIRGAWDVAGQVPPQFNAFADWITAREHERHPEFSGIRLRMERLRMTSEGVESLDEFTNLHYHRRGSAR